MVWLTGLVTPQHVGSSRAQELNLRLLHWRVDSLPMSYEFSSLSHSLLIQKMGTMAIPPLYTYSFS